MAVSEETNVVDNYNKIILLSTNNYPLCVLLDNCDGGSEIENIFGGGVVVHSVLVSYENIYQNMICYPHTTDTTDDKYYIRKYSLPDDKEIILTIDMRTEGKVVSTLSGDTPEGIKLIKTTWMSDDEIIVEYS